MLTTVTCEVAIVNMALKLYHLGMATETKVKRKAKGTYRHGNLKEAILQTALQLIATRGNVDFNLREVAEKTGVSHAAAYRHFKSKAEILLAIAMTGFEKLNDYFQKSLSHDPLDIISLGESYVKFAADNPHYFRVMFHPDLKPPSAEHTDSTSVGSSTFGTLTRCIEANKTKGRYTEQSTEELAVAAWSIVHGLAVLWVNGNLSPLPDGHTPRSGVIARAVATALVNGLKKR